MIALNIYQQQIIFHCAIETQPGLKLCVKDLPGICIRNCCMYIPFVMDRSCVFLLHLPLLSLSQENKSRLFAGTTYYLPGINIFVAAQPIWSQTLFIFLFDITSP